jgi:hypothetical protein
MEVPDQTGKIIPKTPISKTSRANGLEAWLKWKSTYFANSSEFKTQSQQQQIHTHTHTTYGKIKVNLRKKAKIGGREKWPY